MINSHIHKLQILFEILMLLLSMMSLEYLIYCIVKWSLKYVIQIIFHSLCIKLCCRVILACLE